MERLNTKTGIYHICHPRGLGSQIFRACKMSKVFLSDDLLDGPSRQPAEFIYPVEPQIRHICKSPQFLRIVATDDPRQSDARPLMRAPGAPPDVHPAFLVAKCSDRSAFTDVQEWVGNTARRHFF